MNIHFERCQVWFGGVIEVLVALRVLSFWDAWIVCTDLYTACIK